MLKKKCTVISLCMCVCMKGINKESLLNGKEMGIVNILNSKLKWNEMSYDICFIYFCIFFSDYI